MNTQQATNRLVENVAAQVETMGNEEHSLAIALQDYRQARSTSEDTGTFTMADYEIVDHGLDHSQYFQGCGVSFTDFEHVSTGCGDTPFEALEDALDSVSVACTVSTELENESKDYPTEPSATEEDEKIAEDEGYTEDETESFMEMSEQHYYVSVRYNRKFSHTDTAQHYAESIRNGNCNYVIEQLQQMPIDRALAVSVYILEYLPESDHSYRSRFMATLGVKVTD